MTVETGQGATGKAPTRNQQLAARARDLADRSGLGSAERKAALCLSVCLVTTTSVTAARKALAQIDGEQMRQAAADLLDQLTNETLRET